MRQRAPLAALLAHVALLAACAHGPPPLIDHLPSSEGDRARALFQELTDVPFHPQSQYQCGPAALATVLEYSGVEVTPEALVPRVYLPARQGSLQPEIRATARQFDRLAYEPEPRLAALLAEVAAGHPVLVLQKLGFGPWPGWHYAVVIGYDARNDTFILRSGTTEREVLSSRRFLTTWLRADAWSLVVLPPGTLPASADLARYLRSAADLEATGSTTAALAAWEAGTRSWPNTPATWFGLGNVHYRRDEISDAVAAYQQALRVSPTHIASHHNLARLHLAHDCLTEAGQHLDAAERQLGTLPALSSALQAIRAELTQRRAQGESNCRLH